MTLDCSFLLILHFPHPSPEEIEESALKTSIKNIWTRRVLESLTAFFQQTVIQAEIFHPVKVCQNASK